MTPTVCYGDHPIQLSVVRNSLVCLNYKPNVFIGVCIRKETGNIVLYLWDLHLWSQPTTN